jgi:hypothetical protein
LHSKRLKTGFVKSVFVVLGVVAVITIGGAWLVLANSSSRGTPNVHLSSSTNVSINGMMLNVSISPVDLASGGSLSVTEEAFNTLPSADNVSASPNWAFPSLIGDCPGGIFNEALYSGYYTSSNISSGTPLPKHGPGMVPCPVSLNFSYYTFAPSSDLFTAYGGLPSSTSNSSAPANGISTKALTTFSISQYYDAATSSFVNFASGQYTLLIGDIWGGYVILYFTVA